MKIPYLGRTSNSASDSLETLPAVRSRALVPKEQCPMAVAAEVLGDRVRQVYVLTDAGRGLALTFMALAQRGRRILLAARRRSG